MRVKSLAGEPCRIKPGITGKLKAEAANGPAALKLLDDGVCELTLAKGESVLLHAGESAPVMIVAPIPADPAACNAWGLKH